MYDELSGFLTKIKLYTNRGLSDTHELAMFLELYNGTPWTRATGKVQGVLVIFRGANEANAFQTLVPGGDKCPLTPGTLTKEKVIATYIMIVCCNKLSFPPVSGDANFSIGRTSLTVGGFNQPAVARALIELPGNAEKGLSQRFLWMFPKPVYGEFSTLEPTDKVFTEKIGTFNVNLASNLECHINYMQWAILTIIIHIFNEAHTPVQWHVVFLSVLK